MNKKSFSAHLLDILYLLVGPFFAAVGIAIFYTPVGITSGGSAGIANILFHLFHFNVGLTTFLLNVPLIVVGCLIFSFKYAFKTLLGSGLMSLWISVITHFTNYKGILDPSDSVNILLSAIFGGFVFGAGIALTMKSGCNTGGTDIIAQSVSHYFPVSVGMVSLIYNLLVIGSSAFFIGFREMLFSFIAMACSTFMMNYLLTGFGTRTAKNLYIISDKIDIICDKVIHVLHRSGTIIKAEGAYSGTEHDMLLVLVQNHQYQKTLKMINEIDPKAFVFVNEAYSVLGKGFVSLEKTANKSDAES